MTPLVLDVSRLLWRAVRAAPGGIDRVELAMAQHLLRGEPTARFVFTDGGVIRTLERHAVTRLAEDAAARWTGRPDDPGCRRVAAWLAGDDRVFPLARLRLADRHVPMADLTRNLHARLRQQRGAMTPGGLPGGMEGAIYLNLSQRNLDDPRLMAALPGGTRMLACVYDDIPLRNPSLAAPGSDQRLLRMLRHLAARQARLVSISHAARARIMETALGFGVQLSPMAVVPPPIGAIFSRRAPDKPGRRFFLVPGLLTARKNLAVLGEACRALAGLGDFDILLAGAPGLDAAAVLTSLGETPPGIRLLRAEGLSDHAMVQLMRAAIAVLAPSNEEGFDYPVHEALAVGVPVIASDIPAHREYVAGVAELLDSGDAAAWAAALADFLAGGPRHAAGLAAARRHIPPAPAEMLEKLTDLARTP